MAPLGNLVRNGWRVLRKEGPGAFARAFALRAFKLQAVPKAFVPSAWFDFNAEDLAANDRVVGEFARLDRLDVRTINWFVPVFTQPMAGVNNIFQLARHARDKHGVECRLVLYGEPQKEMADLRAAVSRHFPDFAEVQITHVRVPEDLATIPEADVNFATRWDSCYLVLKANRCKAKLYLVQDFEPLFYPAGVEHALAEETYRFGFARVCGTPSTWQATERYAGPSTWIHQPVDTRYNFAPASKPGGPVRIVFYGRPTNPRNGFGLGIEALRRVKERYGARVEIYSMGEPWVPADYGLEGVVTNLGVMDLASLGEFYRGAHVGLGLIFTRHPSLQPLEYWANGIAVVTNENPSNAWCFHDGKNCLIAPPSPSLIADRLGRLVEDATLRERLARTGREAIERVTWEEEAGRVWSFMTRRTTPDRPLDL